MLFMNGTIFTMMMAFIMAVLLSPLVIPLLRKLKFGQFIRDEGPKMHAKKAGTPTMGGVVILVAIVTASLVMGAKLGVLSTELYLLLFVTCGFGLLGFLDDLIKIVKKRNLGLTSRQKLLGQLVIAIVFYEVLQQSGFSTAVTLPGSEKVIDLGHYYLIFAILMLIGASNATNLTDGMDGLLAGTAAVAFGAYVVMALEALDLVSAVFAAAVVGALLGFLVFNAHPARVFMGDTGSLAIGGGIASLAMMTKFELILIVIGGIFVLETLSVMIQVASFKLTGKRVFKMTPIHHHYELSGWSEWRIVATFWSVGFLFAALGVYIEIWL